MLDFDNMSASGLFIDTMSRILQCFNRMFYINSLFRKAPFPSVLVIKS